MTFLLVLGIGGMLYAGGGIGYAIKVEGRTAANEGGVLALLPHKEKRCVDASDACCSFQSVGLHVLTLVAMQLGEFVGIGNG